MWSSRACGQFNIKRPKLEAWKHYTLVHKGLTMSWLAQKMSREPSTPSPTGSTRDKLCKCSRTSWSRARLTCVCVLVAQSCLTLCDPMDCSPPGSSVQGILQARILVWVAMPSSWGCTQPRDRNQVSLIAGGFFTV